MVLHRPVELAREIGKVRPSTHMDGFGVNQDLGAKSHFGLRFLARSFRNSGSTQTLFNRFGAKNWSSPIRPGEFLVRRKTASILPVQIVFAEFLNPASFRVIAAPRTVIPAPDSAHLKLP